MADNLLGPISGVPQDGGSSVGSTSGVTSPSGAVPGGDGTEGSMNLFNMAAMRSDPKTAKLYNLLLQSLMIAFKGQQDYWNGKIHEENQKNKN